MIAFLHQRLVGGTSYTALALIRLFLGAHLAIKGLWAWRYQDYLFGAGSFAQPLSVTYVGDLDVVARSFAAPLGILHIGAALLLAAGLGGRFAAAMTLVTLDLIHSLNIFVLNGGDSLSRYLLLYVLIGESWTRFCLRPRARPAAGSTGELLTAIAAVCIGLHLGLVYAVSGLSKVASGEMWRNGTAIYYILHQERFHATDLGAWLTKTPWVTTMATYGVLLFEIYFPCLLWVTRAKFVASMVGIALHASIAVFMMIYDFQLIFLYAYAALWSDAHLEFAAGKVKAGFALLAAPSRRFLNVRPSDAADGAGRGA